LQVVEGGLHVRLAAPGYTTDHEENHERRNEE